MATGTLVSGCPSTVLTLSANRLSGASTTMTLPVPLSVVLPLLTVIVRSYVPGLA